MIQFTSKLATQVNHKVTTRKLPDVVELAWATDSYITAEELASEYRVQREVVLKILDKAGVWPIAKVINRQPSEEYGTPGKTRGGRPRMAFEPQLAREAMDLGIEDLYR